MEDTSKDPEEETNGKLPRKPSVIWSAMKTVKTKFSLTDEGATPVNWKVVALVFISLFSSSFNITFIFPFLPEMIKTFGYKEEEKGYYAGIVASAMFVGRFFGCYFWGWLSDKKGRKPIVLVTVLLNGVSSLLFGFTTNLPFAVATRLLSGLVNGTVGTAKTILYEISDNTNQAVGMSIISVAWGSGIIVGPAIGGYLANPCKRYPNVFASEGFFYDFPYFFPGIVAFIVCIVAFILDVFLLPETLNFKKTELVIDEQPDSYDEKTSLQSQPAHDNMHHLAADTGGKHDSGPRMAFSVENLHVESEGATFLAGSRKELHLGRHGISISDMHCDVSTHHREPVQRQFSADDNRICWEKMYDKRRSVDDDDDIASREKMLNGNTDVKSIEIIMEIGQPVCDKDTDSAMSQSGCCYTCKQSSLVQMICQYDVFLAVMLYGLFSFAVIGVEEISTVWQSTDVLYDGLGFEPNEIGAVLGGSSLPLLFLQLFIFPNLVRRIGIKMTLIVCTVILLVLTDALPTLHLLTNSPVTLWILLLIINCVMKLMVSCVFSGTALLVNNSVQPHQAGQVNGVAMTFTAFTRSMAPLFGGIVYSWTVGYASKAIGPPFDVSFVFVLFGLVYWAVALIGVTIPDRLNCQKK